jgi:tetratricopeptide (TPR) repeat protein
VLEARIAAAAGDIDQAVALLRSAIVIEDELTYDEPPPWYQPVRQVLGEILLAAGRNEEAEDAFREDLRWVRENGWSLAGLEQTLRAQGRTEEAESVAVRLKDAWKYADVPAGPVGPGFKDQGWPMRP